MNEPDVGDYFVNGEGHLCLMLDNAMYKDFFHPSILAFHYVISSIEFSKVRDATIKEIETKRVINQPEGVAKMDTTFNITLENGHKLSGGLKSLEAAYIEHVYKLSRYNQVRAAQALGISRGCLRQKLAEYFGDQYMPKLVHHA